MTLKIRKDIYGIYVVDLHQIVVESWGLKMVISIQKEVFVWK